MRTASSADAHGKKDASESLESLKRPKLSIYPTYLDTAVTISTGHFEKLIH